MKPGDLIGFTGYDALSHMINIGSCGLPYYGLSHIGIVSEWGHRLVIYESTTYNKTPCMIRGKVTAGVQANSIEERVNGYSGKIWHYSLKNELSIPDRQKLQRYLFNYVGEGYDTIGALRSGGWLFALLCAMKIPENMHTIFCSELCAGAYKRLKLLDTENASFWSPNQLARHLVRQKIVDPGRRITCLR